MILPARSHGDIDGGDGVEHEAAGLAAHAHLVVHGVPESFNLQAGAAELFSLERRFQPDE